jgi:hypothetical protein
MVNLTWVIVKKFQLEIGLRKQQTTQEHKLVVFGRGGEDAPC